MLESIQYFLIETPTASRELSGPVRSGDLSISGEPATQARIRLAGGLTAVRVIRTKDFFLVANPPPL